MRDKTEFYSCGRLNFVTGETGSGKSYAVKEWLNKKNDSRRVVIVGIPEEYENFGGSDVIIFSHRDTELERFLINSQIVKEADVVIIDTMLYNLGKVIMHLLEEAECKIVLVCTERPESLNLPIDLQWTKEKSFSELV